MPYEIKQADITAIVLFKISDNIKHQLIETIRGFKKNKVYVYDPECVSVSSSVGKSVGQISDFSLPAEINVKQAMQETIAILSMTDHDLSKNLIVFSDENHELINKNYKNYSRSYDCDCSLEINPEITHD